MTQLFGTDGVRGIANTELSADLAFRLGQAAVAFLGRNIVVGKDTRRSGDLLEAALSAGIMSLGGHALLAGIVPTPAVALLTRELKADGGVVISASHNPPEYNGIKFFDAHGLKLTLAKEEAIEAYVSAGGACLEELAEGEGLGISLPLEEASEIYINQVVSSIESQGITLEGLRIALDVGHGAASFTSPEAFRRLGAQVIVVNDDFDGYDINVGCGSTHLGPLRGLVAKEQADIGIAHDGDADRVMMISPDGREIDGDVILAVCALDLKNRCLLPHDTVVSTVMCNLGFVKAMRDAGIEVVQTQVGDRHVLEAMREGGFALGGEQSGHIIMLEHNSTGDGLQVAAQFLAACRRSAPSLAEAASVIQRYPQVLVNVTGIDKQALPGNPRIAEEISKAEVALGTEGRVLVRPSGTEPLVRVMVEAASAEHAQSLAESLAETIKSELS
ncbi:MAG: phosphoglucosamine mutase [Coriobacteriaceae bacterium]|jgi:phosphoglucosamine mutase|nr:phosphoglucosamine mutase [Coriobacteriaceae bacterium]